MAGRLFTTLTIGMPALAAGRSPGAGPWNLRSSSLDGNVVDSRFKTAQQPLIVKLPHFIVRGLEPLLAGLMETGASVEHVYWYARSSEFMQSTTMRIFRWMRVPGGTVFFLGAVALVVLIAHLVLLSPKPG